MPADFFLRNFLSTMVQALDHRDQEVVNSWTDALVETIRRVSNATAHREITPVVLAKAQGSKSVSSRVCSCRVLGELATKYDPQMLKKDLIPTITALLLDANPEVRAEMTKYLVKVPPHLGPELTTTLINPLGELTGDDILIVRQNCFVTLVESLPFFPSDSIKTNIQTMLKNMLTNASCKNDVGFLITASEHYGKMYTLLENYITRSEKEFFIRFYNMMSGLGTNNFRTGEDFELEQDFNLYNNSSVVRKNCAYIFPTMVKFQLNISLKKPLNEFLRESFKPFTSDVSFEVRKAIASRFKQVCDLIPKDCKLVKDEFIKLFEDDNIDVLDSTIPNLYSVMEFFHQNEVFRSDSNDEYLNAVMRSLVKCENTLCKVYKWRTYVTFLEQTRDLYKLVPSDLLFRSLIASFMKIIHLSRVVPVRKEAMKNLLVFMRHTKKLQHRKEIKDKIIREFCLSKNFYDRIIYVRIVPVILELYSTIYFKENFYLKTLKLFEDPVSNVRYTLLKVLPHLKAMVKIPEDIKLQQYLNDTLNAISEDKDRDVKQLYLSMKSELEKVDFFTLFPNDKKKFEEEKMLVFDKKDDRIATFGRGRFMRPPQRRKPNVTESVEVSQLRIRTTSSNYQHQTRTNSGTKYVPTTIENLKGKSFHRMGEMSSQEKEFYIDAGIHLPNGIDQIPKGSSDLTTNNTSVNTNKTSQKRWNSPRIPVRRPTSLEIKDYSKTNSSTLTTNSNNNNNNSTSIEKEKTTSSIVTKSRKSHLPRPLSCINFQTSSTNICDYRTSSKQKPISRLPVISRTQEHQQNPGKS